MKFLCVLHVWLLTFVTGSSGLNVLMISICAAGHVIPMFESAEGMKNHNVTFITEAFAQSYIDFKTHPNMSSFRFIFPNDSTDVLIEQKKIEQELYEYFTDHSLFDSLFYMMPRMGQITNDLMNKSIHVLMSERFDVIIGSSLVFGLHALCEKANTSFVVQRTEVKLSPFDVNLSNSYSLLSSKQITEIKYRIYNVAFTLRLMMNIFKEIIKSFYIIFKSFPQIPGPSYNTFLLRNILSTKTRCLQLIGIPPTLYPPLFSDHHTKYVGGFVDEPSIQSIDNDLTRWIKSKPTKSIIYAAFGSTSIIRLNRMKNLINGLVEFLLQVDTASMILAFRNVNYDTYQCVLKQIKQDEYRQILMNNQRVKVENQFVQQKWILQQTFVNIFLSHCGMDSTVEGLYFQKPILCLPIQTDQFLNSIAIDNSGVGKSLFTPPCLWQSFLKPHDFHEYTFSAHSVTTKLLTMWRNITYEQAVRIVSLEMKHAGGVRRAVEEIEFLVDLNGDLERYAPFHSTLPFYQRYMLDLVLVYFVLPITIIFIFAC